MSEWDERFLYLARHVAGWSKDPSTQVGAVIVDPQRRVVSIGYNGPPRGVEDSPMASRQEKLLRTVHAEQNAILFAVRPVAGCSLYVTHHPCAHCAAVIVQAGITRVVHPPAPPEFDDRWRPHMEMAARMLREAGVRHG